MAVMVMVVMVVLLMAVMVSFFAFPLPTCRWKVTVTVLESNAYGMSESGFWCQRGTVQV
jgi:hypothetical protein